MTPHDTPITHTAHARTVRCPSAWECRLVPMTELPAPGTSSNAAYNAVLDSVGNNHQGTIYPKAEQAVEPLLAIALATPGWPAKTALSALTEMIGSFQPVQQGWGAPDPGMKQRMRMAVGRHRGELIALAQGDDSFGTAERARELLAELNEDD